MVSTTARAGCDGGLGPAGGGCGSRRWVVRRWAPAGVAALLLAAGAGAEPPPSPLATLEDLLAHAEAHHPALQAARAEQRAERETAVQARALGDPLLGLRLETMEERLGVGVSQVLPLGGKRGLRGAVADEGALAAARRAEGRALEVAAEVVSAYSELVFLLRARELVAENASLVGQLEQVALTRYRTGEAPYADVVRAQVEVGRVEDELRSLEDARGAATGRLNAAVGRPVDAELPTPGVLPSPRVVPTDEQVLAAVRSSNPELAARRHHLAAARHRLELAQHNRTPDLMFGLELMHSRAMGRSGVGAMVGVTLPLWRAPRQAEVREATARAQAATALEVEAGLRLEAEARATLFRQRDAARRGALYGTRLIPQAEQSLAATLTAYRAGEATFSEVVESARLVLELRLGLERARADELQHLAELEVLMGRRVTP